MIRLENVSKYYSTGDGVSLGLRKISLEISNGEFVVITGSSGSGKTTLLNVIAGLDTYEEGEVYLNGFETSYYSDVELEVYRNSYIGFVFQNYNIINSYTVYQNVEAVMICHGYDKIQTKERIVRLIQKVGLIEQLDQKASKLSGGQKQRCVIARALACESPIIICDEPTANLDSANGKTIIELLHEISKNRIVIMVTHNYEQVQQYATRKIRMNDGEIVENYFLNDTSNNTNIVGISSKKITFIQLLRISIRNLISVPRKSLFIFFVSAIVIFSIILFLGFFLQSIHQPINDHNLDAFPNDYPGRVIVSKYDGDYFFDYEISDIYNMECGLLIDSSCVDTVIFPDFVIDQRVEIESVNSIFEKSIIGYLNPVEVLKEQDIVKGKNIENIYEIVLNETNDVNIGSTFTLKGDKYSSTKTFKVVGLYRSNKSNDDIYVSSDTISDFTNDIISKNSRLTASVHSVDDSDFLFETSFIDNNDEIDESTIIISSSIKEIICDKLYNSYGDLPSDILFEKGIEMLYENNISGISTNKIYTNVIVEESSSMYVLINYNYNRIGIESFKTQLSIYTTDQNEMNDINDTLKNVGYNTFCPVNHQSTSAKYGKIISIVSQFFVFIFILIILFIVFLFTVGNVVNSKSDIYLISRSIGFSKKDLRCIIFLEILSVLLFALIFNLIIFITNELYYWNFIPRMLVYFNVSYYIIIITILFIFSFLISVNQNKKIYRQSITKTICKAGGLL